ncbi:MAG: hypothetical protein QM736_22205 [Vicinamibacterales bacterium]
MSSTMPPGGPSLSSDQYAGIVAYILQQNSAQPGPTAFTVRRRRRLAASPPVSVLDPRRRSLRKRRSWPVPVRPGAGDRAPVAGRRVPACGQQGPRGVTVAGEVKN